MDVNVCYFITSSLYQSVICRLLVTHLFLLTEVSVFERPQGFNMCFLFQTTHNILIEMLQRLQIISVVCFLYPNPVTSFWMLSRHDYFLPKLQDSVLLLKAGWTLTSPTRHLHPRKTVIFCPQSGSRQTAPPSVFLITSDNTLITTKVMHLLLVCLKSAQVSAHVLPPTPTSSWPFSI